MPDKTFKLVEIVGESEDSVQQAVRNALKKASKTLRNIDWFEVSEIRGWVKNNSEPVFQVQVKVGFRLLDRDVRQNADAPGDDASPSRKSKAKAPKGKSKDKGKKK